MFVHSLQLDLEYLLLPDLSFSCFFFFFNTLLPYLSLYLPYPE